MAESFAFISYRRADEKSALLLHQGLTAAFGAGKVWLDHEDIAGGTEWMASISDAVASCSVFIVLIGRGWADPGNLERLRTDGDIVRAEIEQALARRADPHDGLAVVPVRFDGTAMPEAGDLPPSLAPLLGIHAPGLRDDKFLRDLTDDLVPGLVPAIGPTLCYESRSQRRMRMAGVYARLLALLGVCAAAVVGAYAMWEYLRIDPDNLFKPDIAALLTEYIEPWEYALLGAAALVLFLPGAALIRRLSRPARYRLVRDDVAGA